MNPLYMFIIVINVLISSAINIIEFILAPTQIIINGPSATFGSEFNIVRYGSIIFDIFLLLQSMIATIIPIIVAIEKLTKTSYKVTPICFKRVPSCNNPSIVLKAFVGLDDVNVFRYAEYLKKFTEHTQFLVITHRKGTMEAADTVYGVTMEESGISKLLSMKLNK